jgi:hypothetical protein
MVKMYRNEFYLSRNNITPYQYMITNCLENRNKLDIIENECAGR